MNTDERVHIDLGAGAFESGQTSPYPIALRIHKVDVR